jgi:hypothetical protein
VNTLLLAVPHAPSILQLELGALQVAGLLSLFFLQIQVHSGQLMVSKVAVPPPLAHNVLPVVGGSVDVETPFAVPHVPAFTVTETDNKPNNDNIKNT